MPALRNLRELSDDELTDEELAIIYGRPLPEISCEDDAVEHELEAMGAWD